MKPLLIFGLRGTLLERCHPRNMLGGMPPADLTVGVSKVWLRPNVFQVLRELQKHCNIAVWSSTTARNTTPLVEAVFRPTGDSATSHTSQPRTLADGDARGVSRFARRPVAAPISTPLTEAASAADPILFQFVWSREHTSVDDYRRSNSMDKEDSHATLKDLDHVYRAFPSIATPQNTIMIDDTPSKTRRHAANFLWLGSCEGPNLATSGDSLLQLQKFVEEEVMGSKDVRLLLPHRIR